MYELVLILYLVSTTNLFTVGEILHHYLLITSYLSGSETLNEDKCNCKQSYEKYMDCYRHIEQVIVSSKRGWSS